MSCSVIKLYCCNMDRYSLHTMRFNNQRGMNYASDRFSNVYQRPVIWQSGRGISNVFTGLWRILTPFLSSTGKFLRNEGVRASGEILSKLGSQPLTELLQEQKQKTLTNALTKSEEKLRQLRENMQASNFSIKHRRGSRKRLSAQTGFGSRRKKIRKPLKKKPALKSKKRRKQISKSDFLKKFSLN